MQFRLDAASGPELSFRGPGPGCSIPAPPLRGIAMDYDSRVDDRRYAVQVPPRQQQLLSTNSLQGDGQDEAPPSRHLWVGNVSQEVSEGQLVEKFVNFGSIESLTVYSQRNYAFINFKTLENARDAKNGLQGVVLGGLAMRIEFAKGAKPSRHLWVGGIGQTVSREVIEGEFQRFGIMEDFKFLRDRNCAFVDYEKIEDAIAAVDSLNRKRLGEEELRVDFGRSQPHKRETTGGRPGTATSHEEWGDSHSRESRDQPDQCRSLAESYRSLPDAKQAERGSSGGSLRGPYDCYQAGSGPGSVTAASGKTRGEKEDPSDVLWVGFPLLSKVDEDGLRRAFVPYGEVERVKTFPGRTYAFVQFKNVEEASRAKAALEGKLFNDPRVHIRFSNSEIGPVDTARIDGSSFSPSQGKDAPGFSEKAIGRVAVSDRFGTTVPLRSTGLRPEYFPGGLARGAALPRAVGPEGVISLGRGVGLGSSAPETRIPLDDRNYRQAGSQGSRGLPGSGGRSSCDEQLDFRDQEIVAREAKRPRTVHGEVADPLFHSIYQGGRRYSGSEGFGIGLDSGRESYGPPLPRNIGSGEEYSQVPGLPRVRLRSVQFERPKNAGVIQGQVQSAAALVDGPAIGLVGTRDSTDFAVTGVNEGWRWHGTIAKGGTPVCRARCLPVGKGIDVTVPDVVNCTARTDLDMLAKHVYQAGDFGVVFFVPEADPDVPPYHDFMHYLGEKHRAGVAKLVDGTTLFLVPPSEFSERVLKVPGNNCLFGVVLKAPQANAVEHAHLQQLQQDARAPQQHHFPSQILHSPLQKVVSHQQQHSHRQGMVYGNGHATRDNSALPSAHRVSAPSLTAASNILTQSQLAGLTDGLPSVLTPELIASLTALLPAQNLPSAPPATPRISSSNTQPLPLREGMGVGGIVGRIAPNSGSTFSVPAATDNRSAYRSLQSHQQPVVQAQSWPSAQSDQQLGIGGYTPVPPDHGSGYTSPPQHQPQVSPSVATVQSHSGPLGLTQHAYPGAPSQGLQGSGFHGQQVSQHHRPPQQAVQIGGAPLLPSEQLAQLTALLTQTQQQPAQQHQAAQLLQQHYQQQQTPLTPLAQQHQQPASAPSHQSQGQIYVHQPHHLQQLYSHSSPQQQWIQSGSLPQHLSQSLGHLHVLGSSWDGATGTEGQQQQPASQTMLQSQVSLPQQHVQQLLPSGVTSGDQTGGTSQDETERQNRFQATLQLAAALLQQMQHQQNPGQGNPEQR